MEQNQINSQELAKTIHKLAVVLHKLEQRADALELREKNAVITLQNAIHEFNRKNDRAWSAIKHEMGKVTSQEMLHAVERPVQMMEERAQSSHQYIEQMAKITRATQENSEKWLNRLMLGTVGILVLAVVGLGTTIYFNWAVLKKPVYLNPLEKDAGTRKQKTAP